MRDGSFDAAATSSADAGNDDVEDIDVGDVDVEAGSAANIGEAIEKIARTDALRVARRPQEKAIC